MKKDYNKNFENTARELGWNCNHAQANPHLIIFSYPISDEMTYSFTIKDDEEMLANICYQCGSFDADLYVINQQCLPESRQKVIRTAEMISEEAQTIALKLKYLQEALEDVANDFLVDHLLQTAVNHGWNHDFIGNDMIELGQYTPAGEDFSIVVNRHTPVQDASAACFDFDEEDHVFMWLQAKRNGINGVPDLHTLVEDADAIHEMLLELRNAMEAAETEFYA